MKHRLPWVKADGLDSIVHATLGLCAVAATAIMLTAVGRFANLADRAVGVSVRGQLFVLQLAPDKTSLSGLDAAQLANDGSRVAATNRTSQAQAPRSSTNALIGG